MDNLKEKPCFINGEFISTNNIEQRPERIFDKRRNVLETGPGIDDWEMKMSGIMIVQKL